MKKTYWICDCVSPLPDRMENTDDKCEVCGMKKKDIRKRLKELNSFTPINSKRYCPKCSKICKNMRHQSILQRASLHTFYTHIKGQAVLKYTDVGIRILASL